MKTAPLPHKPSLERHACLRGPFLPAAAAGLFSAAGLACAGTITFDEPGYISGQRPPVPWFTAGDLAGGYSNTVVHVAGTPGTQYLAVQDAGTQTEAGYYPLPRPLTAADGAQRIIVRVAPATSSSPFGVGCGLVGILGAPGTPNFAGNWISFFQHPAGPDGGPIAAARRYHPMSGEMPGETLGAYVPGGWHEVTFAINEAWTELTISVKLPDGTVLSAVEHEQVTSEAYDSIVCGGSWNSAWADGPALFDDLQIPRYKSSFTSITPVSGGMELRMFGEVGQVYELEHAADPAGTWHSLTTLTNSAWTMSYTDLTATNAARCYRLREH